MTQTQLETVPAVWDDELDGAFFALVHHLFPPAFLSGATALLTSYDEEEAGSRSSSSGRRAAARARLRRPLPRQ